MTISDQRGSSAGRSGAHDLERGRECYRRRAWANAYESLARADAASPLEREDLECLAVAAYFTGRDDEYLLALERAHHAHLEAGATAAAVRAAFWLGLRLLFRGEMARASGWLGRAHRLLARDGRDCVEYGYLLLPAVEQHLAAGDKDAAYAAATHAAEIGERFGEADLVACARNLQGRLLILKGEVEAGLALLDETMLAVTSGDLSPLISGLIYCSVIESCQKVYALGRAHEWTAALARWCEAQPDMVPFTGTCRVHRAEILQLQGAWNEALEEARRACERFAQGREPRPPAAAYYQEGEVHRLRGEFAAAEAAYRRANEWGCDPQPGLALLRLAQGRIDAAAAAIRRALNATAEPLVRTRFLPAYVDIMLAARDMAAAREACTELEDASKRFDTDVLRAWAAHARGAVALAAGDAAAAVAALRRAGEIWQRLDAPHAAARTRLLAGLACRALGDRDTGRLELEAARAVFVRLGAAPDVAAVDAAVREPAGDTPLTARELQVLRLVADGKTNRAIAAELHLSEKTVDRHLSNILTKLNVPSRAAATAYAYQHKLI